MFANLNCNSLEMAMTNWIFCAVGAFLIIAGFWSKKLVSESDVMVSEEDREQAKATRLKRFLVGGAGIASLTYGVVRLCL